MNKTLYLTEKQAERIQRNKWIVSEFSAGIGAKSAIIKGVAAKYLDETGHKLSEQQIRIILTRAGILGKKNRV